MIPRKILTAVVLAGSLCIAMPAAAQKDRPQKGMDPNAVAEALKNCPALQGRIDPAALAAAMQNCPAFNGQQAPNPRNCPAFQGNAKPPKGSPQAFVDKKMNRIVKALERNKRSADTLIEVARQAGASPESVADMQRMSEAFRQVFMSTVSPDQIINSLLEQRAQPAPAGPQEMIITGPDGSAWIITPAQPGPQSGMQATPPPPGPKPGPKPGQQGGKPGTPPMQGKPSAIGRPVQPQFMPPQPAPVQPAPAQPAPPQLTPPQAPQGIPAPGYRMPPAPPQAQPGGAEVIIMEETVTPEFLPLWPTKDDLGKDGVLKYLEKRSTTMRAE